MNLRLLHLSDLHFGRANAERTENMLNEITMQAPDIVVISGDFTQRARHSEFRAARDFIARLKPPVFTVPGNHDIPYYQLSERLLNPFARYRAYINPVTNPVLALQGVVLVGLNTARPFVPHWNWAHGMVSHRQIESAAAFFRAAPTGACRILICHHPLIVAADIPFDTIVWRAADTLRMLQENHVDILLTGHLHHASVTIHDREQLVSAGAGTAISTRLRGQDNGYNMITISDEDITIELIQWQADRFSVFQHYTVKRNRASPL